MEKINNSNYIKFVIIGGIILFFGTIFIYNLIKLGVFNQDFQKTSVLTNTVVFEQPKLSIFDDTRYINQFPDTIHIHYPYFIVVVPEDTKQITTVYSLTKKTKIASFNDVVLDYYNGSFLYNYHGGTTYYNGKNLKYHCDQGFIKSDTDILCVIQNSMKPSYSDLMSINPQTLTTMTIYSPQDAITAIYYMNNSQYIGEYNYNTHQTFITLNGKKITVNNYVSIFYPMKNSRYTATFKNDKNNLIATYSRISTSKSKIANTLIQRGIIIFY
jgi:hypothetical protein